jgi:hypothetical protein
MMVESDFISLSPKILHLFHRFGFCDKTLGCGIVVYLLLNSKHDFILLVVVVVVVVIS